MSRIESFISAFNTDAAAGELVQRIEIPLIQRDYAQGRHGVKVDEIRESFLSVLHDALAEPNPQRVSLDFIYGEIDRGTLQPLDGQQRLTTLFLLHWYLAARAGVLDDTEPWTRFSYATRQSARRFCERLVTAVPPSDVENLSGWIVDQSWYLFVWRHDPTIQAMLVMLDAIHQQFAAVNAVVAWERLADTAEPAVSFHLLPLPDMGSAEDLYIKMNSRGKPLSDFENFKAHFEKIIESSSSASEFARKVDVDWVDVFWHYRGDDDLVDDEFLRYFEFVTEVCEWSDPLLTSDSEPSLVKRAERIFGNANPSRAEHLEFLFSAFDVWVDRDIPATFNQVFGKNSELNGSGSKVPLFFRDTDVNLFESCCRSYGLRSGGGRQFTFGQTLILLAVLLHITHATEDFPHRIRVLRNLVEGSTFEMRAERMPRLIADTTRLILAGELPQPGNSFSLPQIDDEEAKQLFRAASPEIEKVLNGLEDHPLLRGSLNGFELDVTKLETRAGAFREVIRSDTLWSDVAGALLTIGEYQRARGRDPKNTRSFQFVTPYGANRDVWRLLLTGATQKALAPTNRVLADFLDNIADRPSHLAEKLRDMQSKWLAEREAALEFDWRYYMVKYPDMRSGGSGIYFAEGGELGYSLCNLRGGTTQMNSRYRDPYLLTIWRQLGEPSELDDPWFIGHERNPRYLTLTASGTGIQCFADGYRLSGPAEGEPLRVFDDALLELGIGDDGILAVAQTAFRDRQVDTVDRIEVGTALVRALISKGL
ncbi:DUF262 domain-containing protein [Paeniglutamicibacter sulfureus]|uniref:GmrSD restriction endonucleases N-terminal domain-containing protein n=1 Tax=Paeniglutamicibacter sulfureus TaxID=43666 RepID=A0ABU2BH16_9MICC|nr:DUF262 domain-containing protein [Paeniglutamicibacter sulfureus]MDR7357254.1 hypothetical protein [Paeniglutamicibacter sulfureus]